MQKVLEMHETEENPPPGGRVVRVWLQPGAGDNGIGTVVATPEGGAVVAVVVGLVAAGVSGSTERVETLPAFEGRPVDDPIEHPHPAKPRSERVTAMTNRLCPTCLPRLDPRRPNAPVAANSTGSPAEAAGRPSSFPTAARSEDLGPRSGDSPMVGGATGGPARADQAESVRKTIPVRGLGWK
jgi:hypothetical protein